jgi:LTXXQ motif family protein
MTCRMAKIFAVAIAFGFGLETSFTPGAMPGVMSEAFAFGHGGFGGGHFGGGGGFGGGHFGGGHFGGFGGGHFGGGGGHFGGIGHFGGFGRFGGFRGGHFGGMHFGRHFGGGHFGGRHFGGGHIAHGHFGGGHFGGGRFGHANFAGHRFGGAGGFGGRGAFAHNEFGGRRFGRFNGVRGFDAHGFNRNAFGSMAGWNAWGNNYWGAGWNDWGSGWGYWAGPVFWPFLFGDALTFALWPYTFYDPFFAYGSDLLLTSIFWPGPLLSPYYANDPYYYGENSRFDIYGNAPYPNGYASYDNGYASYGGYGGHHHRGHHRLYAARSVAHANVEAGSSSAQTCGGLAPGVLSLPVDQIERAIRPTDTQATKLNNLKAASAQADNMLLASCPVEVPLTPIARLDAVLKRIQAMSEAAQILRPPLAALYNSLDDEQKDRFAAIGTQTRYRRARIAPQESLTSNLGGLCKQQTENFTQLPLQRIEGAIKPAGQQNAAFETLKSASAKAAKDLDASCPAEIPQTLTGRLDAVGKRLDALVAAVTTVKPALTDFYDSLTDEQKAHFNVIGRVPPAAAPQGETRSGG